jgi:hypothetical protein
MRVWTLPTSCVLMTTCGRDFLSNLMESDNGCGYSSVSQCVVWLNIGVVKHTTNVLCSMANLGSPTRYSRRSSSQTSIKTVQFDFSLQISNFTLVLGYRTCVSKTEDWPPCRDVADVRRFLGTCGVDHVFCIPVRRVMCVFQILTSDSSSVEASFWKHPSHFSVPLWRSFVLGSHTRRKTYG